MCIVSVPYRGATFLNRTTLTGKLRDICFRPLSGSYISQLMMSYQMKMVINVSVPYRGATFLNGNAGRSGKDKKGQFPSPIGELHFSIRGNCTLKTFTYMFPSPIGELHFSICISNNIKPVKIGFRPLSGSYISQSL